MMFQTTMAEVIRAALYHYGPSSLSDLAKYFEASDEERTSIHMGLLDLFDRDLATMDVDTKLWSLKVINS